MVILSKVHRKKDVKSIDLVNNNNNVKYVEDDGLKIKDIESPSLEVRLCAVKQNGLALKYIDEQTEEICREAVAQNKDAVPYVIDSALRLQLTEKIEKNIFHPDLTIDDVIDEASRKITVKPPTGGFAEEMKQRGR
jgi:hypothetical protein